MISARDGATAGRAWLQRLGTLALFFWIVAILVGMFAFGAAQFGISVGTLEELTTFQMFASSAPAVSQAASYPRVIRNQGTATQGCLHWLSGGFDSVGAAFSASLFPAGRSGSQNA
jgi:hypothetical protein